MKKSFRGVVYFKYLVNRILCCKNNLHYTSKLFIFTKKSCTAFFVYDFKSLDKLDM